ncbi:porin [Rhizobium sp.]
MNIKSLLLGSAAALAVVSGAQAADAVVAAEPEPMEYVRVCDAYGTGFFYIPGTETCLKVGGLLRFEKNYAKADNSAAAYEWHTRARIQIEAKNDSEWGTVYSWIRLQGDSYNNTADGAAGGNQTRWWYYFGIGGLEFGRFDAPGTRFQGYGGRTDWGGYYGNDHDQQYVSYTFNYDNFSAFVAIENDLYNGGNYAPNSQVDLYEINSKGKTVAVYGVNGREYMPNVSAGVKGAFGDYEVGAFVGYDESIESFNVRKWVRGDIGMFGFTLMGLYSDDARNEYFNYDGFSGILGLSAKVTDTVTVAKDIQWWDDDSWRVIGNVNWEVASGFSVLLEASYGDGKQVGDKVKTGMLRFQRSF